ncbi:PAS domain S-box protein [Rubrivirga sp. IMCC43871]|uniref:sensor histidine kinase n=1 Tax=Rubrivirga sp. IMCC43871 TaxID=3391575 RepID=UPI00398F97B1
MSPTLPPALAAPLAELALRELAQAGFGEADATGRTEATIVADALGAPAALFALDADTGQLVPGATAGWEPQGPIPVEGVLTDALQGPACVALSPVPQALAASGVRGGLAVRIGTAHRPFALLAVLPSDDRAFGREARAFLLAAAAALHARFALDDTRRALEESRSRALSVLETTVDGVLTIDDRGTIESYNAGAARIFEYAADEVVGQNVSMLMPEPYHSEHNGYLEAYRTTGVRRIIGIGREVVGRRKSGATFPMDLAVSEVALPDGRRIFNGFVRDISERRVLEREVLRIAEAERRRIGQDLHDGLGQQLTAIGLFVRNLARTLDAEGSDTAVDARRIIGLLDDADSHARGLARSLVPVELEQNGLEAALARLAERATALYGVAVTAATDGSGPAEASALTPDAASNLYWIAQEAVSNAVQHGRAASVTVHLVRGTDRLRLRVEDDGVGLGGSLHRGGVFSADTPAPDGALPVDPDAAPAPADHRGMGLRIMHYRAHLAGGALDIRSGPHGGTLVTCTVPLRGTGFLS